MNLQQWINIIGAGLAGSEAAWQAAERGCRVRLYEMRPQRPTGAHRTANFAELVCSNSLKSDEANTAPRLLKDELAAGNSLLLRLARQAAVPAGGVVVQSFPMQTFLPRAPIGALGACVWLNPGSGTNVNVGVPR